MVLPPDLDALGWAIAIVEDSRGTHVEWLEWQQANPDWRDHVEPDAPGDEAHHARCITEYDHVLGVLRSYAPESDDPHRLQA